MTRKKCSISRKSLEAVRVQAIKAWKRGARVCDLAETLGVHPNSVSRWVGRFHAVGARGLRSSKASGRPRTIDCREFFPQLKKVVSKDALCYGFDTPLWTTRRLQTVFWKELNTKLSRSTVHRLLTEAGLSFQKPEQRAFQQDPDNRREWLKETWPKLQKQAKKQRAVILFLDECSVSMNPTSGKTWARIGRTPSIKTTASRSSIGLISAISRSGKLYFTIPKGNIDSTEIIRFLEKILKQIPRKRLIIVLDNCKIHKSNKTTSFVDQNPRLELHFLPPYSPDFNPDELVWAHLKQQGLAGHQARTKDDLRGKTLGKMRSLQKRKSIVKAFAKKKI
jgi:transposase